MRIVRPDGATPSGVVRDRDTSAARPDAPALPGLRSAFTRRLLPLLMELGFRAAYRVECAGLAHYTGAPGSLVAFMHRRDVDGPLVAAMLHGRHSAAPPGLLPCFAAREDLFRRGFLAHYLPWVPPGLRRALLALDLGPVLSRLGVHPLRRIAERSLVEVLEDVEAACGELPVGEVLRPRALERMARRSGRPAQPCDVVEAARRLERDDLDEPGGFFALRRAQLQKLKAWERRAIDRQISELADVLDRGEVLQYAPEGVISPEGSLMRVRCGLHRLLDRVHRPVRVLPVGLVYDACTRGRTRVFLRVGPPVAGLDGAGRRLVAERVTRALAREMTVTTSQLVADRLLQRAEQGAGSVDAEALAAHVETRARTLARRGVPVDRALEDPQRAPARVAEVLAWGEHHRLLRPIAGSRLGLALAPLRRPRADDPHGALPYLRNELHALLQAYPAHAGREARR